MADYPPKVVPWNDSDEDQQAFELTRSEAILLTENIIEAVRTSTTAGAIGLLTTALEQLYPNLQGDLNQMMRTYIVEEVWNRLRNIPGNNMPPQLFLLYENEFADCDDLGSAKKINCLDAYLRPTRQAVGFSIGPVTAQFKVAFGTVEKIPRNRGSIYRCRTPDPQVHYSRLFRFRIPVEMSISGNITWEYGDNYIREQWACTPCCPVKELPVDEDRKRQEAE